jgi:hypothetical protein
MALADGAARAGDGAPGGKGPGRDPARLFKRIDANGDGKVSKEEFKAFFEKFGKGRLKDNPELLDKLFDRLDANGDGSLSPDEFKKLAELREKFAKARGNKGKSDNEP